MLLMATLFFYTFFFIICVAKSMPQLKMCKKEGNTAETTFPGWNQLA